MCGFDTLIIGKRRSETLQVATVICLKSIIMACSFYGGHCFFRYLSIIPSGVVKNWCFPSKKSQKLYCFIKGGKHFKFSSQKLTCICSFQRQNSNMKKPTKNYETFSGKYPTVFWPKKNLAQSFVFPSKSSKKSCTATSTTDFCVRLFYCCARLERHLTFVLKGGRPAVKSGAPNSHRKWHFWHLMHDCIPSL